MASVNIGPTRFGLDLRRRASAGQPGTFRVFRDVVVSNGGEIQKRKAWVPAGNAAGTVGMASIAGQLFVFGSGERPETLDSNIGYMRLQYEAQALTRIVSVARYGGKPYIVARFESGRDVHFYDGTPVAWWEDNNGFPIETVAGVADYLATVVDASPAYRSVANANQVDVWGLSDFAVNASVLGSTDPDVSITWEVLQPYVAAAPAVGAQASFTVAAAPGETMLSIKVNGVEILGETVVALSSYAATATLLASKIAAYAPWLDVSSTSGTVYMTAPSGSSIVPEGSPIAFLGTMQLTSALSFVGLSDAAPAIEKRVRYTINGDYDPTATYNLILDGVSFQKGDLSRNQCDYLRPFGRKLWAVFDEYLSFSAIDDPTFWDSESEPVEPSDPPGGPDVINPVGAGFLRLSSFSAEAQSVKAIVPYSNQLLAVCQGAIAFIQADPDPDATGVGEIIETDGTRFPLSVRQQGSRDVLFVSSKGIRSVQGQASYDAPFVADVGAPIDSVVRPLLDTIGRNAEDSVVNAPDSEGRAVFFIGSNAYVLSYFPDAQVAAWSEWTLPGVVSHAAWSPLGERLWIRCGNSIFLYGGQDGNTYDATKAIIQTSFNRVGIEEKPSETTKMLIDVEGRWTLDLLDDPSNEDHFQKMGEYDGAAGLDGRLSIGRFDTWLALRLESLEAGPAMVSSLILT